MRETKSPRVTKMSVAPAIFQIAQEGNHLTCCRLPTNRNFVHGGPTGRVAQVHLAPGKRKGIEMATLGKKLPKKLFVEIPTDISEMSDAQIDAWAKKAYEQLIPILEDEVCEEVN